MDLDRAFLVANVATLPTPALCRLIDVVPTDIEACRSAEAFTAAGALANLLDAAIKILSARGVNGDV
jgi:hypothetical protein